jgi:hypothetical protein
MLPWNDAVCRAAGFCMKDKVSCWAFADLIFSDEIFRLMYRASKPPHFVAKEVVVAASDEMPPDESIEEVKPDNSWEFAARLLREMPDKEREALQRRVIAKAIKGKWMKQPKENKC